MTLYATTALTRTAFDIVSVVVVDDPRRFNRPSSTAGFQRQRVQSDNQMMPPAAEAGGHVRPAGACRDLWGPLVAPTR